MDGFHQLGEPELSAAMKKAQAKGFLAIANEDAALLAQAGREWPQWVSRAWREQKMGLATLPLPAAARAGWAEGVRALAALGADVNAPDACRQGIGKGRPPLAEAVSKKAWGAAQALIDCGARMSPAGEMLWACSFLAWRESPREGVDALRWLKTRGLDLWAGEESAQANYLFAGGVKKGTEQEREEWARELFEGRDASKETSARMWHFVFGAGSASVDVCDWLAQEWQKIDSDASRWLLEWGLEYGCPKMAGHGALGLSQTANPQAGLDSLGKACAVEVGIGSLAFSDEKSARDASAAFAAAWEHLEPKWSARPQRLAAVAKKAMAQDNAGLLDGLLRPGVVGAAEVVEGAMKNDRRYGGRESKGKETMAAWMAARLREGAAPESMRETFDDLRRADWLDRQAHFEAMVSKAQNLELRRSTPEGSKARPGSRL